MKKRIDVFYKVNIFLFVFSSNIQRRIEGGAAYLNKTSQGVNSATQGARAVLNQTGKTLSKLEIM